MSFFARRNGAADADFDMSAEPPGAAGLVPQPAQPPAMADALMKRFTGMGLADVQQAAGQAGEMLSAFKASLDRIEQSLAAIDSRLTRLESKRR